MTTKLIYRIVAALLLVFALGHTLGFTKVDPSWGVGAPIAALREIHFTAQGTPDRTYWGFYLGFGYFCSVLMLFAACVAWQLGGLPSDRLRELQFISWAFAMVFVVNAFLMWRFFFTAPMIFTVLIALGLIAGAWRARTS